MIKFFKKIFQRKPKPFLLDNTYRIVPAFEWKGTTYYMHEDPMNTATGRGLTTMMFMEEVLMRCSVDYLKAHVEACDSIFSDPKKINLPALIKLNSNMKERINLLVALPSHVYKMASIVFFTKEESPYRYDHAFNKTKIQAWAEEPGMYDFFFGRAVKGFDAIFNVARKQFREIFGGGGKDKSISPERSVRNIIQAALDSRHVEFQWVCDKDPIKERQMEQEPLISYWFKLNEKIIETKKEAAKASKKKK